MCFVPSMMGSHSLLGKGLHSTLVGSQRLANLLDIFDSQPHLLSDVLKQIMVIILRHCRTWHGLL